MKIKSEKIKRICVVGSLHFGKDVASAYTSMHSINKNVVIVATDTKPAENTTIFSPAPMIIRAYVNTMPNLLKIPLTRRERRKKTKKH